ncbi:MAG: antibiotic biosynthesis monooxygenase [Bryobacterales bacterium]|nr:antibiotic biosynthesis monooxygenase [Bryobacterales bacterium]
MSSSLFALHLEPPYYAVIFPSLRKHGAGSSSENGSYEDTAQRMAELAKTVPGYLGIESARSTDGFGITVSYWRDENSIAQWKRHLDHALAQERGKREWYQHYELRVAKVERAYSGPEGRMA